MKTTLQKRIAYFWLLLATINFINSVYQIIRGWDTWGILSNGNAFSSPYFELIFPYSLFKIGIQSVEDYNTFKIFQLSYFIVFSLFSVLIPIFLMFNVKYSRVIAKVYLVLFIVLNFIAIFLKLTQFLPVRSEFSEFEINNNKYLMNHIYYFSIITFIAILMFVGLLYCKSKKQENIKKVEV